MRLVLEGNSPALVLALASAPRAFLRYNCRMLSNLKNNCDKQLHAPGAALDEEQRTTFKSFKAPIEACAIKIDQFSKMMDDIDGTVRAAYSGLSEAERATAERLLFVNSEILAVYTAPVERMLGLLLPSVRREIDVSALFFHDVGWLGFHDDAGSRNWQRRNRIDAVRKVVLPKGGVRLRRCTRCCSIVDEAVMSKTGFWLNSFNRMCLCGTLWMHLSGDAGSG